MRRSRLLLTRPHPAAVILGGLLGVAAASVDWPRLVQRGPAAAYVTSDAGTVLYPPAPRRHHGRDVAAIQRKLRQNEAGTYIGDILLSRDSSLARWPDRTTEPLRIWVQPTAQIDDWEPSFPDIVEDAFREWGGTGIPVRFRFVSDSARADVHVQWVDHFEEPISGKTKWARDEHWWIVDGDITIAVHHNHGEALDESAIKAIALHEVGHLLGLDHSADSSNIMTAKVRVRDLSAADRATLQLIYTLPPGAVR